MPRSKETINPTEVTEGKKKSKERFALQPTHIPGVSLRTEPGQSVDITRKTIREVLYPRARRYRRLDVRGKRIAKEQEPIGEELKELARTHENLRGIQSEPDNLILSIIPRDVIEYDQPKLEADLGSQYKEIVTEDYVVSVKIPRGFKDLSGEEGRLEIQKLFELVLTEMGVPGEDAEMLVNSQLSVVPNEKKLRELTESGEITLKDGTRKATRSWAIKADILRKPLPRDAKIEDPTTPQQ